MVIAYDPIVAVDSLLFVIQLSYH